MIIDIQLIITAGSLISAVAVVWGAIRKLSKWIEQQEKQDKEIANIKKEQCLIVYGMLACLKGLKEQGCNGPVTEAITKLEKHLNTAAHDVE